jgi:hypothetical protein
MIISSAVNQIQFWLELNEAEIERELLYAEDIGINSLRVFLHNYLYEQQPDLYWKVINGQWKVERIGNIGELAANTEAGGCLIVSGNDTWKDYTVQAVVMLRDRTSGGAGIAARIGSLSEGYYVGFNTDEVYILRIIGDKEVRLISKKISNVRLKVRNSLKVTVKGNILSVYLNDPTREIIIYYDNPAVLSSGGIGLFTADCRAAFDDIAVLSEV